MKISELMHELSKMRVLHGNVDVVKVVTGASYSDDIDFFVERDKRSDAYGKVVIR